MFSTYGMGLVGSHVGLTGKTECAVDSAEWFGRAYGSSLKLTVSAASRARR